MLNIGNTIVTDRGNRPGDESMIYLDNSATTKVSDNAAKAALHYMQEEFFNPSAAYRPAVKVDNEVGRTRERMAATMGAASGEIIFTGGGTEGNNIAIMGSAAVSKGAGSKYITTSFEHPSVAEVFTALEKNGNNMVRLGVDGSGYVSQEQLEAEIDDNTVLVSIMHVNNELGTIQNLSQLNSIIKRKNPRTIFHSDGVQAYCKLLYAPLPVDLYTISGHKFHAPKGVGALLVRQGIKSAGGQIGGGQERGLRSGTINSAGIIAMGEAILSPAEQAEAIRSMRGCKNRMYDNLQSIADVFFNGPPINDAAPHILNISFMGVRGETLLHALEEHGIYISTGSACSSHKSGKNYVLSAIGLSASRIESAVRISLSRYNTLQEMDRAAEIIHDTVKSLRKFQRR